MYALKSHVYTMVLLSGGNHINIKKNHMLQCIERKKNSFQVFVIPLTKEEKEIYIINDTTNVFNDTIDTLTEKDMSMIFQSSNFAQTK